MFAQRTGMPRKVDLRSPGVAALIAFAVAVPAFALIKAHTAPHYALSKAGATRIARSDPQVARILAAHENTSVRVGPLDAKQQRVSFFDGPRFLVDAAVNSRRVTHIADHATGTPASGSAVANAPAVLLLLTLLFVIATASMPVLSLRNLDVLALASFTGSVWLLNENLVLGSVYASYPPLAYLAARCMNIGLRGTEPASRTSMLWHLTRKWPVAQRMRVLKTTLAAAALIVVTVVPSSTGTGDVGIAAISGATDLLHGVAPYGHIPNFIVHGDTYPLLTYALYTPGAALMPFHDLFSDPSGALLVTAAATLLAALGLYRIGLRLARGETSELDPGQEPAQFAAMLTALAWLAFPAVILSASSGANDPVLAACLVGAFACFARRGLSFFLLGLAAWVKVIPALALPIWLARLRRRSALQALAALAALSAALLGWLVAIGGPSGVPAMVHSLSFQFDRGSLHSLWVGLGLGVLQPGADALLVAALVAATLTVRRDETVRDDLRRMAALFAGVMLLSQIAANYWTWAYLPWALVPILLSLLAPSPARSARATGGGPEGLSVQERVQVPVDELVAGQQPDEPPERQERAERDAPLARGGAFTQQ
jgi:Glycosyltransferase family 87